jgi:hypothetical protein
MSVPARARVSRPHLKPGQARHRRNFRHHSTGKVNEPREQRVVVGIDRYQARRASWAAIVVSRDGEHVARNLRNDTFPVTLRPILCQS